MTPRFKKIAYYGADAARHEDYIRGLEAKAEELEALRAERDRLREELEKWCHCEPEVQCLAVDDRDNPYHCLNCAKDLPPDPRVRALAAENAGLRGSLEWERDHCPGCGGEGVIEGPDPGDSYGPAGGLDYACPRCCRTRAALASPSPLTTAIERVLEAVVRLSEALNDLRDAEEARPDYVPLAEERVGGRVGEVIAANRDLQALLEGKGEG